MSETKVEIVAAKEVSAVMSHPKSCMCEICQTGSGTVSTPGLHDLPQMPIDMLVGRIKSLEEQLQIRDAEIHLLKESRAAAVSQEQSSRVECNRLRGELSDLTSGAQMCVGAADIGDFSELCGWIDKTKTERARLRKALEEISQLKEGAGPSARAWTIANEALKGQP